MLKKMKRKDKIYSKLKFLTEGINVNELNNQKIGFDAEFIGKAVGVNRNNTSTELNKLVKEGKVLKIKGKPVLYLEKNSIESKLKKRIEDNIYEGYENFIKLLKINNEQQEIQKDDLSFQNGIPSLNIISTFKDLSAKNPLDTIIGSEDSLKKQIEQAKAAIVYPPNGLHTLLTGPTGVGKSMFAEAMYKYAIQIGKLPQNAPLVVFNCADYAENPQLLLSHLFGHTKGAFTGADKEKNGIISQANGGILFLDEVHRLPPEGQEMLFLLMDKGIYRRMGEDENVHKAQVLIIAATTEDPQKAILHTFLRRIPVLIKLPSLSERPLKERMMLICRFFYEESERVKVAIKVSKEILKALMLYDCPGNIGQLKSDIQLICARAFLDYINHQSKMVEVKLSHLSSIIREGLFRIDKKREEIIQGFNLIGGEDLIFDAQKINLADNFYDKLVIDEYRTREDFYDLIQINWNEFSKEGLSNSEIKERIDKQIQGYFNSYLNKVKKQEKDENLDLQSKVISPRVLQIVEEVFSDLHNSRIDPLNHKVIYGLALHVETLLERLKIGAVISHPDKKSIMKEHPTEYKLACQIKEKLEEKININIPEDEAAYIAMFLYAVKPEKNKGTIGVLVLAHGPSTATSMVRVTNSLLGVDYAYAIDMPLDEKVDVALEKAIEQVKKIDKGKGVLLMVDMGSLVTFGDIITEKTGIDTRTVEMVSTPMVIEATRKAMIPGMNLDMLVEDVLNLSSLIGKRHDLTDFEAINTKGERFFEGILIDTLDKTLTFLNPKKAYKALKSTLERILEALSQPLDKEINVKFTLHCACMLERAIRGEALPYKKLDYLIKENMFLFNIIKKHFKTLGEIFGVSIPDTELAYVLEIFEAHFNTLVNIK